MADATSTLTRVATRKCLTCQRWAGDRHLSADRKSIAHAVDARGECVGGPWNHSMRETRSGCGRWVPWVALKILRSA